MFALDEAAKLRLQDLFKWLRTPFTIKNVLSNHDCSTFTNLLYNVTVRSVLF